MNQEQEEKGRGYARTEYNKSRQAFKDKIFGEFNEFFDFEEDDSFQPSRDDTVGADLKFSVTLDFLEAAKGCDKEVELNKRVVCEDCGGRRANVKEKPRVCFECGGKGSVIGNYGIKKKCSKCDGSGCQVKIPCRSCEGLGV